MLGTDKEPGIYVRTLNDLFRAIEETSDDMLYSVSMSYLEVSFKNFQTFIHSHNTPNHLVNAAVLTHLLIALLWGTQNVKAINLIAHSVFRDSI